MIRWIHRRQLCDFSNSNDLPIYDPIIKSFNCYRRDEHEVDSVEPGIVVPPFVCKFCPKKGHGHVAAVADEDGIVRLLDTRVVERSVMKAFPAHNNAIFDLAWLNDSSKLVTASGDQSAVVWDVENHVSIATMRGHSCSLKSIAVSKSNDKIMATGARDGNVMVWDLRCHQRENGSYAPVKMIHRAHTDSTVLKPPKIKRRRLSQTKPSRDSQQSVTSVIFQEENVLLTSGATDGAIKLWDLRKSYHGTAKKPLRQFSYAGLSTRRHGYSCLTLDPSCSRLYASCTDDIIYEYNLMSASSNPVSKYRGHQNSTFYVKSCLSSDGNYLLSGSSDNNAYIWKVGTSESPVAKLTGHQGEVTSVSWCPEDFHKIMTCADDNTFRLWRSDTTTPVSNKSEQGIVGTSEVVKIKDTEIVGENQKVNTNNSIEKFRDIQKDITNNSAERFRDIQKDNKTAERFTANLPTAASNLFSVVKLKQKKTLKDVSLKTCWKMQQKDEEENVVSKDSNEYKLENVALENNISEMVVSGKVLKSITMSPTRQNISNKINKENSPTSLDSKKEIIDRNMTDDDLYQFDSPKRCLKNQSLLRNYLSPTANLPNRVLDSPSKRERLPQVWNNTKSGESRKLKANWLKEYSKKLSSDATELYNAKDSPKRTNVLKKLELRSPYRKRQVQSPSREDICLSPTSSRPSSPVSSRPTTPKMRKISAYFQPIANV